MRIACLESNLYQLPLIDIIDAESGIKLFAVNPLVTRSFQLMSARDNGMRTCALKQKPDIRTRVRCWWF